MSDGIRNTSVYMNADDLRVVQELMESTGMTRSSVFRLALRRMHEDSGDRQTRLLQIAEEIRRLA